MREFLDQMSLDLEILQNVAGNDWLFFEGGGLLTLVAPSPLGLWMGVSEQGQLLLSLIARQAEAGGFDPHTDLDKLSGSLWRAIEASPKLRDSQRKIRAWQTWGELFEGLSPAPCPGQEPRGNLPF